MCCSTPTRAWPTRTGSIAAWTACWLTSPRSNNTWPPSGKARDFRLIHGTEITLADGPTLALLATSRAGYGNLSQLVTLARRQAPKGSYRLTCADLLQHRHWLEDTLALIKPKSGSESNFLRAALPVYKLGTE